MEYKDNILGPNQFSKLSQILNDSNMPFFFHEATAYLEDRPESIYDYSFSHLIYMDGQVFSQLSNYVEGCVRAALDNAGEKINELWRIRVGLCTGQRETVVHTPHIDYNKPHKSALLYMNDTDGDTIFYNEFHDPKDINTYELTKNNTYTEYKRVTPKANRFVWFDGLRYHSSSTPVNTAKRLVININYV